MNATGLFAGRCTSNTCPNGRNACARQPAPRAVSARWRGRASGSGKGGGGARRVEKGPPPPPPPRTKWTRRVPHPVLIGHISSLSQGGGGARRVEKGREVTWRTESRPGGDGACRSSRGGSRRRTRRRCGAGTCAPDAARLSAGRSILEHSAQGAARLSTAPLPGGGNARLGGTGGPGARLSGVARDLFWERGYLSGPPGSGRCPPADCDGRGSAGPPDPITPPPPPAPPTGRPPPAMNTGRRSGPGASHPPWSLGLRGAAASSRPRAASSRPRGASSRPRAPHNPPPPSRASRAPPGGRDEACPISTG